MLHSILFQVSAPTGAVVDTLHQVANATGITAPTGPTEEAITPMSIVMQLAWVMFPLIFFLLISIYFAIERLVVILKARKLDSNFMHNIKDYLHSGKIDSARELCRTQNTPIARIIEKGISRLGKPTREISEAMETAGKVEIARVEKNLHYLSLVSRIAPMIGFIGTIAGVITIFHSITLSGDISIKTISGGLYQKMFSSGMGLVIGVIAFLFYHLLNTMVDGIATKMEKSSMEFLDMINEPAK